MTAAEGPLAGAVVDIDTAIAEQAPELIAQINENFEDSVLLVGRTFGELNDVESSRIVGMDRVGIDLEVASAGAVKVTRLAFAEPITDPARMGDHLIGLVLRAREVSGEAGSTAVEKAIAEASTIRTSLAEVTEVTELHPHLRSVTVRGDDLVTMPDVGPDAFLYLLLPPPGRDELTVDRSFTWEGYWQMPEAERPVGAYYTVRRFRPEVGEVDLLMVLHGDAGPGSAWAAATSPGDVVALWGPRTSFEPPEGTDSYLLVADETGLPAAASIIEWMPAGTPVRVVAEVDSPAEQQDLPDLPWVEVTWCHREGAPAGTTTMLADTVRALDRPPGQLYVWGGGESRLLTAVRKHVRNEWGLTREQVSLVGYWRHADHTDDPDDAG